MAGRIADIKDDDPRPVPEWKQDVPTFVRVNFWISGFLTIIVGLVFVGEQFEQNPNKCQGNNGCIGPSLRFGNGFNIDRDLNGNPWRTVFSLRPSLLVNNWTPVFIGIVSFTAHFPGFNYSFVTRTWLHCGAWNVFLAIFGHLGYSGNLGIMFGTYTVIVGIMCVAMQFTRWRNERPILHVHFNHLLDRWSFMVENDVVFNFARALSLGLGIASIISGFIFVLTQNFVWCPAGTWSECFGPSLRWNSQGSSHGFAFDANGEFVPGAGPGWRSVFTFNPEIFFPMWGPVIFGYLTVIQHIEGRRWAFYATWPRVFLWFLWMGLFCNMGYTGSFGVLIGFFCIFQSILAMIISMGGGTNVRTHFQIRIHYVTD